MKSNIIEVIKKLCLIFWKVFLGYSLLFSAAVAWISTFRPIDDFYDNLLMFLLPANLLFIALLIIVIPFSLFVFITNFKELIKKVLSIKPYKVIIYLIGLLLCIVSSAYTIIIALITLYGILFVHGSA